MGSGVDTLCSSGVVLSPSQRSGNAPTAAARLTQRGGALAQRVPLEAREDVPQEVGLKVHLTCLHLLRLDLQRVPVLHALDVALQHVVREQLHGRRRRRRQAYIKQQQQQQEQRDARRQSGGGAAAAAVSVQVHSSPLSALPRYI